MKRDLSWIIVIFICFYLYGCATPVVKAPVSIYEQVSLISIDDIAKKYNLSCKYFPFSETVLLYNEVLSIELKPGYEYVVINDDVQKLKGRVVYHKGEIFVPCNLLSIIQSFSLDKQAVRRFSLASSGELKTVVIDPGHGGRDPGAVSPWGLKEKEVNLGIALYLKDLLVDRGCKVYLTRNCDRYVSLEERVLFAREKKADLFISIHANAYRSRKVRGFEVYYLSPRFSSEQSKILAVSENLIQDEGLNLSQNLKLALGKLLNNRNRRLTMELASSIIETADKMGIYTRKIIGAPFYVLKYNICPSVLIEAGYMTNRQDEKLLRTSLYRKQLALSVAEGFYDLQKYFNRRQVLADEYR